MMMLTKGTARSLGVTDRLDPQQSISGGARYLAQLVKRIPPYIPDPDRLWMALAAYNVGLAHLQDARVLAVELREDPNAWPGVRACLPRLSQKRHYLELRHRYARGHEAAAFVEQIRNYYDLLLQSTEAVD
jgi:membrane-bound lytic murein transglycosylase F